MLAATFKTAKTIVQSVIVTAIVAALGWFASLIISNDKKIENIITTIDDRKL